jgi:2-dehydro-3-deoxyphosphogluconate aldolase/(4S)-4-hydroxy-2-oxoglutarate aldolase
MSDPWAIETHQRTISTVHNVNARQNGGFAVFERELLVRMIDSGIVGVIRTPTPDTARRAVEAVMLGGITTVEITFTVPNAAAVVREVARSVGSDVLLGAGTITDTDRAKAAIDAGARFIVAPNTDVATITTAHAKGALAIPGALTPTEVVNAVRAGADAVKIFPVSAFGPSYVKALLGPLPGVVLMPTGGIEPENIFDHLAAGAKMLGVGGTLVDPKCVAAGDYAAITRKAREFLDAYLEAKARLARTG